ncbi:MULTISPECIES: SGNH/GDSL hydrolase family protein [unclassified Janthinobacterium]|uniref:SGNH/GDSL hydrolase family protein n=1 Tax=unclassified Janthinobacterium TaxID=2610881 RepID=UPI001E29F561|nr:MULTISPECIES: SGNH/GDSL hydrolase family protein [unclassified Janthinobacterium]MCC7643410.1 SGNH/GDSL hydrolase family protein [Janthinobacterium sp. EB271-G4-3-1]MCC7693705.1 SGNH/GDSL hydrolase family protein [Janthinobacterium sp. EB271-G4-3-2]
MQRLSLLPAILLSLALSVPLAHAAEPAHAWLASWTASPQAVWRSDFLFPSNVPAVLHGQTVRQVARLSVGGPRVRIVLSNAYGKAPLRIGAATVALAASGSAIEAGSLRTLTFAGQPAASVAPGAPLVSDPVELSVPDLARLTVSIHLPQASPVSTFHWDGRETAWIAPQDQTRAARIDDAPGVQTTTARLLLSAIQVEAAPGAQAVVILGDSISDGATASLGMDARWPDFLARRLAPHGVAVINAGISGARLLSDGMGDNAQARFERDVLAQPGVRTVVVLLGINDISWPGTAFAPRQKRPTLEELTNGYTQLIAQARSRGVRVIGATLTPFEGALPGTPLSNYYQPEKDALRQQVNAWIRASGSFDAVLDFDALARDPAHPLRLLPAYDSGDHLHPGDAGNRALAEGIDLPLLFNKNQSPRPAYKAVLK